MTEYYDKLKIIFCFISHKLTSHSHQYVYRSPHIMQLDHPSRSTHLLHWPHKAITFLLQSAEPSTDEKNMRSESILTMMAVLLWLILIPLQLWWRSSPQFFSQPVWLLALSILPFFIENGNWSEIWTVSVTPTGEAGVVACNLSIISQGQ